MAFAVFRERGEFEEGRVGGLDGLKERMWKVRGKSRRVVDKGGRLAKGKRRNNLGERDHRGAKGEIRRLKGKDFIDDEK